MSENAVNLDVINNLRSKMNQLCRPDRSERSVVSSGSKALDQLLPSSGFERGTLVELLVSARGSGAMMLSLLIARQACLEGGSLFVFDRRKEFYPPAAAALGIDLERMVLVRSLDEKDEYWAIDQALRCSGVSAVWAWVDHLDSTTFRRWQLAAESSGCLGLLLRPAKVQGKPSWSDVQLSICSLPFDLPVSFLQKAYPNHDTQRQNTQRQNTQRQNRSSGSCAASGFVNQPEDLAGSAEREKSHQVLAHALADQQDPFPYSDLSKSRLSPINRNVRRMRVQLIRSRSQNRQGSIELEFDHLTGELRKAQNANRKTHSLHLATQLAHPKSRRRSTGT